MTNLPKGCDLPTSVAPVQQFPKTTQVRAVSSRLSPLLGRTFETKAEYDEAIADFKNGQLGPPHKALQMPYNTLTHTKT